MKKRIGLISTNQAFLDRARLELGEHYYSTSKNVLEFHQKLGSQIPDYMMFLAEDFPTSKELMASLNYARTKIPGSIPIAVFHESPQIFPGLIKDRTIRAFPLNSGFFLADMTMASIPNLKSNEGYELIPFEKLQQELLNAVQSRIGRDNKFDVRPATDDEIRTAFFCQMTEEVSTNLLWFKFAIRILDKGNDGLKKIYQNFSESEMEEAALALLNLVVTDFMDVIKLRLKDEGALFLGDSISLAPQERKALLATAKSKPILFSSEVCSIAVELIQYF